MRTVCVCDMEAGRGRSHLDMVAILIPYALRSRSSWGRINLIIGKILNPWISNKIKRLIQKTIV